MHDSTCESSEEVGSEAAVEYDEENPDYESDEYHLVMDFTSLFHRNQIQFLFLLKRSFCFQLV